MAKGIFVVHYSKKGLDVRDQGKLVEFQFKAFVSPKAADMFIADLIVKYPKA